MSGLHSVPVDEILKRGRIDSSDIRALRRVFYEDGIVTAAEAERIFELNDACTPHTLEWSDFFVESITDYMVFQEAPQGYLNLTKALWLIDRVSHDGRVASKSEMALLINILDKARWSPVSLTKFALEQVKAAVIHADGPLRKGKVLPPGRITEGEVDLLRRILYAFGGDGNVAVTREEADVLFDIDEAVESGPPNPVWTDFFVKAVANVMMAASGYSVPSREEALRHEASAAAGDPQASVLAALLAMAQSNLASVCGAYRDQTSEERALTRLEHQRIEIITNEEITETEASWLVARLGRDGRLSPSEMALIAYLKQESPKIHPALIEAVDRLARAA